MKKAQITLFVMLGITILVSLIILASVFYLPLYRFNRMFNDIDEYTRSCLYQVSQQGIAVLAKQGGELDPGQYQQTLFGRVSLKQPTRELFAEQLNLYVEQNMDACLQNYSAFVQYTAKTGAVESKTTISQKSVLVMLKMPLTVNYQKQSKQLEHWQAEHKVMLGYLIDVADYTLNNKRYNLNYVEGSGLRWKVYTFDSWQVVVLQDKALIFAFSVPWS